MRTTRTIPRQNEAPRRTGARALRDLLAFATLALLLLGAAPAVWGEYDSGKATRGAGMFRSYCASCHGTTAVGDGDIAQYLKVKPSDLTEIAKRNGGTYDVEQVMKIIDGRTKVKGHGHGEMPVWGDAFLITDGGNSKEAVKERIENLAHFLWSMQK